MAAEAMKKLVGLGDSVGSLTLYDGLSNEWQKIRINKRTDCVACAK